MAPLVQSSDAMSTKIVDDQNRKLLSDYATTSRAFSDAVERLRQLTVNTEPFISALAETGAAHRLCERSRIALDRHLARRWRPAAEAK